MLRSLFFLLLTGLLLMTSHSLMADEIWIDVRTTEEFNAGHLEGALHIPYEEIATRISEVTEDKQAVIHLYCRSGNRSGIAQQTLQTLGYTQAINEGGYEDLRRQRAE